MSYLVTGGAGFIGSYVVRDLVREGERVVIYDVAPRTEWIQELLGELQGEVEIIQGDVLDLPLLLHVIKSHKIQKIVHMASLLAAASEANPPQALKVNCEGTSNVFEAARALELAKVVWASSVAVFGPAEMYEPEYISDDAPHYPWGVYGATKSFNERMAECYFSYWGVDVVGVRFPLIYGAGQRAGVAATVTEELMVKPALGKAGEVPYGDDVLNWLYVEDASRAIVLASKTPKTKRRAFNTSGDLRSMKEASGYVKEIIPQAELRLLPGTMGGPTMKCQSEAIKQEVGFQAKWSLRQGVREVITAVQRRHDLPSL